MSALAGAKDHGGVDDIFGSRDSTQLAGSPSSLVVQWLDLYPARSQKPTQANLASPITPNLTQDSSRYGERQPELPAPCEER